MATFRLRSDRVLLQRALDKGIKPSGSAIAAAAGLPATTINQLRNGRAPSAPTMATLMRLFDCDILDLFEIVNDDEDVRLGA